MKPSCKVTYDKNHLTVKVRFKNEFGSVQHTQIYSMDSKGMAAKGSAELSWLVYGQLPSSASKQPSLIHGQKTIHAGKAQLSIN